MPPYVGGRGSGGRFPRRGAHPEDADEDEDELLEWDLPMMRDTVLWLIDAGPKMHDTLTPLGDANGKQTDDGKVKLVSLFHRALRAAFRFQRSKLVNSPADHCGILLFNTRDSNVLNAGKNVAYSNSVTLQPITQVAVPPVAELGDELQESLTNGPSYFRTKYAPSEKQSRIHYAFGNAEAMLLNTGKAGARRVFFVTNEDDPMADKKGRDEQGRLALDKVKSMTRRGIEFEPFLISTDDQPFNTTRFYSDIFAAYPDDDADFSGSGGTDADGNFNYLHRPWNATTKFDDMETGVDARETPKRVIFSVPMFLGTELTMGVKGYCTLIKATKGVAIKVKAMEREDEDDPVIYKEVVAESVLRCADTGRELDRERDVDTAYSFGTESSMRAKVRFSPAEVRKMRMFGQQPSIRILGFKPAPELHFYENVKHAYFIYPSDAQWQNSQRAFCALLESMATKDKIALAIFAPRTNAIPSFAALIPQLEERSAQGQIEPPGMYVIPLPYADDIRDAPDKHNDQLQATAEQVDRASAVVRAFSRNAAFNPDFFPNPGLVQHYRTLLAVAFNDEVPDEVEDKTLPNYALIKKRAGLPIEKLNDAVHQDPRLLNHGTSGGPNPRKRIASFAHEDEPEIKRLHAAGTLSELLVPRLKAICDHYRLPTSGRKIDLVGRIDAHMAALSKKEEKM